MTLALTGIALGLLLSLGLTRLLSSILYGVRSVDATTFAAVSVIMIVVAFLAQPVARAGSTRSECCDTSNSVNPLPACP